MKCREAEKLLSRSFDGLLESREEEQLEHHIKYCTECGQKRSEYCDMLDILRTMKLPDPKPYFWERLRLRLKERKTSNLWPVWKQWGIRAIPVSIFLLAVFAAALSFFNPQQPEELSPSEAFLLQNTNPFRETSSFLDQEKVEDKNMMLIFASLDEEKVNARYAP